MDQSVTGLMVHFILVLKLIFSSSPFGFNAVSGTAADRPYMHASHADYRGEASRRPRVWINSA